MPFLYNWALRFRGDGVRAHGLVSAHPKFSSRNGLDIHTAQVMRAEVSQGVLRLNTASGSVYDLMPQEIEPNAERREETAECLATFHIGADFVERCLRAREEADRRAKEEEPGLIGPGELLLVTVGLHALRGLFRAADGTLTVVEPTVHLGMVEDSILVTDWSGGAVDFRYFPRNNCIEPYHISDGLETIKVKNLGGQSAGFGKEKKAVSCPPGEVTVIPARDHDEEGLFSPDAVNGKGLYNPKSQKKAAQDDGE